MLVPWLQRSADQTIAAKSKGRGGVLWDHFWREVRTRTGMQIMVANVVNTLQQLTGVFIGAVKVNPRHLKTALWRYVRQPLVIAEEVAAKSDFMRTRTTAGAIEVQQTIDDLLLDPSKYEQARQFARRHGFFMQQATQSVVDVVVWTGAYDQAAEEGATEKESVRRADGAVRLTQGSFNPEDVSRFETGTPFARAFTMFYSYFNMQANLLGSEFEVTLRELGLKKGAGRLFYVYLFGFMAPAVLSEALVRAGRGKLDENDDDSYLDDFMSIFFGSQVRTLAAMVPVFGQAAMAGINALNDKWYDDRISTSPAIATAERAIVSNAKTVYRAVKGEDIVKDRAIRDFLTLMGLISGLPLAPIGRPLGYLAAVSEGREEPTGPLDVVRGLVTGRTRER